MARKLKNKRCYYCGKPVNSVEHAPPGQLFKGFPCDKITVYSCAEHNTSKSNADDAIIKAMLISLRNSLVKFPNQSADVLKAIEIAEPYFPLVKNVVTEHYILQDPPEDLAVQLAHVSPKVNIRQWMRQLTAALVYNATKAHEPSISWDNSLVFSAQWYPADVGPMNDQEIVQIVRHHQVMVPLFEGLNWQRGWPSGANNYPYDIYRFDIYCANTPIVFRHRFFNAFTWYVTFESDEQARVKLSKRVINFGAG